MQENLNETDTLDMKGIKVSARYYMQIFDYTRPGQSRQREQQILVDSPLQYYFAFSYKPDPTIKLANPPTLTELSDSNFVKQGTWKLFPRKKMQVVVRFENLADKFDAGTETHFINVNKFARDLYQEVNNQEPETVDIREVSLSGNQYVENMQKFAWKGKGDTGIDKYVAVPDRGGIRGVALEPMRIR